MFVSYRFSILVLGSALVIGAVVSGASENEPSITTLNPSSLAGINPDLEIAFCALDIATDLKTILNEDMVDQRYAPWSTFKIPNLIIALESGVAIDLNHRRVWDQSRRPSADHWPQAWKQNQTLASAFKRSVVWYFQDIARKVGTERYRFDLQRFRYGNESVPASSDDFWLGGPLTISPCEQTYFLKQVLIGALDLSPETKDALREVSLLKTTNGYALHGKTGSGRLANKEFEGWLVGWIEREKKPTATFALYMRAPNYRSLESARFKTAKLLLQISGYLPLS